MHQYPYPYREDAVTDRTFHQERLLVAVAILITACVVVAVGAVAFGAVVVISGGGAS